MEEELNKMDEYIEKMNIALAVLGNKFYDAEGNYLEDLDALIKFPIISIDEKDIDPKQPNLKNIIDFNEKNYSEENIPTIDISDNDSSDDIENIEVECNKDAKTGSLQNTSDELMILKQVNETMKTLFKYEENDKIKSLFIDLEKNGNDLSNKDLKNPESIDNIVNNKEYLKTNNPLVKSDKMNIKEGQEDDLEVDDDFTKLDQRNYFIEPDCEVDIKKNDSFIKPNIKEDLEKDLEKDDCSIKPDKKVNLKKNFKPKNKVTLKRNSARKNYLKRFGNEEEFNLKTLRESYKNLPKEDLLQERYELQKLMGTKRYKSNYTINCRVHNIVELAVIEYEILKHNANMQKEKFLNLNADLIKKRNLDQNEALKKFFVQYEKTLCQESQALITFIKTLKSDRKNSNSVDENYITTLTDIQHAKDIYLKQ